MLDFLLKNLDNIIFISVIIAMIIIALRNGYKKQINEILLYLVLLAEERYGDGTGKVKFSAVATWLYEKLPSLARLLFTSKQIEILINNAVEYMKRYLEENTKARANILGDDRIV